MNDFVMTSSVSGCALALRAVDVSSQISGLLAKTTLTQRYRNDTDRNLEISYTFPLPVDGVLLTFAVQIGDRHYQGQVMPRSDAEEAYEAAIAEGDAVFRIQEVRAAMYSASLGNVMPGEAVDVCITYAETLRWNGQSIRYRVPTTIAPRYGEPSGMQPWQRPETRVEAEYPLSLRIQIQGALAGSAVSCPSHKVAFKPIEDALEITLAAGATMDRDFVLEIENGDIQSLGVSAESRGMHVAFMTLLPPAVVSKTHGRDTVIVLDCSGSMEGDSLRLAKEGVQLALGALTANEHFAFLAFGDQCVPFDKEFQPANRKNLQAARDCVSRQGLLGGTELVPALRRALEFDRGHPMDILLLTDGEAWNLDVIADEAIARRVRLFTVGIGSAVAEDTVRMLADRTGGACELVSPSEDMGSRIFRHFARMRQPELASLTLGWAMPPLWEIRPEKSCFAGDAYTVVAAFDCAPQQSVATTFEFVGQPSVTTNVVLAPAGSAADAVVQVAASARLPRLAEDERQAWAVLHQLITDQTDCIITVARSADERPVDQPELQVMPQMLPAGWGGASRAGLALQATECRIYGEEVAREAWDLYWEFLLVFCMYARSGKWLRSQADFLCLVPPVEVLVDALIEDGYSEERVLNALRQALIEHRGAKLLDEAIFRQVVVLQAAQPADRELVVRFVLVLDSLFEQLEVAAPELVSQYQVVQRML